MVLTAVVVWMLHEWVNVRRYCNALGHWLEKRNITAFSMCFLNPIHLFVQSQSHTLSNPYWNTMIHKNQLLCSSEVVRLCFWTHGDIVLSCALSWSYVRREEKVQMWWRWPIFTHMRVDPTCPKIHLHDRRCIVTKRQSFLLKSTSAVEPAWYCRVSRA